MEGSKLHCIFSLASSPVHLNLPQPAEQQGQFIGHLHSILQVFVPVLVMVPEYRCAQAQENSVQLLPSAEAIWKKNKLFLKNRYKASPKLLRLDKIKELPTPNIHCSA